MGCDDVNLQWDQNLTNMAYVLRRWERENRQTHIDIQFRRWESNKDRPNSSMKYIYFIIPKRWISRLVIWYLEWMTCRSIKILVRSLSNFCQSSWLIAHRPPPCTSLEPHTSATDHMKVHPRDNFETVHACGLILPFFSSSFATYDDSKT